MDTLLGKMFTDKYRVLEILGEGASARVYLAYDEINERNVALKILKNYNIDEKKIRGFEREARAISRLNHDNIIKVYEIGEWKNYHYIAQEYVDGISLKEFVKTTKKILLADIVDIGEQILAGLSHAHDNKVIHKDIKSQNILYNINKQIKITDFGIADILEEDVTKTQSLMGTPQYVAPEILSRHRYSEQSDIYAVGIVLYELLLGSVPFVGEKPTIIMMKQLNQPLPSIIKERSEVPQSLENVIIKATAKRLGNRYQTAMEMQKDLESSLSLTRRNEAKIDFPDDLDEEAEKTVNLDDFKKVSSEEKKKKKRRKYILISSIILGFLLLVTLFLIYFFGNSGTSIMPNLKDKSLDDSKIILKGEGIEDKNIIIKYQRDNKVDSDSIIKTDPKAGKEIYNGDKITLYVSRGPEQLTLENYVGENEGTTKESLENYGFKVTIKYEYSKNISGVVINQNPQAGKKADFGSNITITVSKGVKKIKVDNFEGLKIKQVKNWAKTNDVNINSEYVCNDTYDKDKIFAQDPEYDTYIEQGDTIELKISKGKCETDDNTDDTKDDEDTDKNNSFFGEIIFERYLWKD